MRKIRTQKPSRPEFHNARGRGSMGNKQQDVDQETWTALRTAWMSYRTAVDAWIEVAESGPSEDVDRRIHVLIAEHNSWSEILGSVVDATHHH